jgi:hypothetical protein
VEHNLRQQVTPTTEKTYAIDLKNKSNPDALTSSQKKAMPE